MKTIEERAEKYADKVWTNPMFAQEWEECKRDYIQGAKEQKEIDDAESGKELLYVVNKTTERVRKEVMDKACEWLEMHIEYWLYDDGFLDVPAMLKDFRKVMEE